MYELQKLHWITKVDKVSYYWRIDLPNTYFWGKIICLCIHTNQNPFSGCYGVHLIEQCVEFGQHWIISDTDRIKVAEICLKISFISFSSLSFFQSEIMQYYSILECMLLLKHYFYFYILQIYLEYLTSKPLQVKVFFLKSKHAVR